MEEMSRNNGYSTGGGEGSSMRTWEATLGGETLSRGRNSNNHRSRGQLDKHGV